MSPKPEYSMLLFTPYYLFKVIFNNKNCKGYHFALRLLYFLFLTAVWCLFLTLPSHIFVNYMSANVAILTLIGANVYCHVDSVDDLFADSAESHLLYDLVVSAGSVSVMLCAAYVPQFIVHRYSAYCVKIVNLNFFSLLLVIAVSNYFFVLTCKEVLMRLPKTREVYLTKLDLKDSHYVLIHYLVMIIFLVMFLQNDEFVSTMHIVLASLIR